MIEKMTKYALVLHAAQSDDFIEKLRELGLVDITVSGWEPSDEDRQLLLDIEGGARALESLKAFRADAARFDAKAAPYASGEEAYAAYTKAQRSATALHAELSRLEKSAEELREYVSECFGEPMLGKGEAKAVEDRLCRDKHGGCILHFTRGEMSDKPLRDGEARLQRIVSKNQEAANRKYYMDGLTAHRLAIIRLTEKVRNCILVHLDDSMLKSRAGMLDARAVWRAVYLNDGRIFQRHERTTDTELSVDLLLDGSASQLQRQESVATQAYILAESLTRCGVHVRVYSFCTVGSCTVLRIYRDYDEPEKNDAVFEYAAAGFNRDGLALRAANYMLSDTPYEHRLLITLSDCSPNDVNKLAAEEGRRREYQGEAGVADSAAEVERLRRQGVSVMCVFTGEEADLPNARRIYGRELVRIRHISQFADAVGKVIVELIGSM